MKLNAALKKVSNDGRVTIPRELANVFDSTQRIYVIKYSTMNDRLVLTQKTNKSNVNKVIHSFMPYNNGTVQFSLDKCIAKKDNVVIYPTKSKTVTIHCF